MSFSTMAKRLFPALRSVTAGRGRTGPPSPLALAALVLTAVAAAATLPPLAPRAEAADPMSAFIDRGIQLPGARVKLPQPLLGVPFTPQQQQAALEKAAGRYGVERFSRDAVTAATRLEMEPLELKNGTRVGEQIDLYFVAYGDLKLLRDRKLLDELLKADQGEKNLPATVDELTDAELAARGITLKQSPDYSERVARFRLPIVDRVMLSGISRGFEQFTGKSLIVGTQLDPRLVDDSQYPSRWQHVDVDNQGVATYGKQLHPYSEFAGYAVATELTAPKGALLIECHVIYHEPEGWFDGKNLLRSRLRIVSQNKVRSLRRKLAD